MRKDFADLLKWSGEITTDAAGTAEVPLEFPDNLTTWKARVWVLGSGTRVGEGSTEIITSKDLLVRLQAPRFLVERDEAILSAVVHNEHPMEKDVKISLELDGTAVTAADGKPSTVKIPAKGEARVDWKVKAAGEGIAKVRMRAETQGDGDAVERDLPVRVHGMARQDAWSRVLEPGVPSLKIPVEVPDKLREEQTKLTVRFSPTVAGAVVDAIPYLAEYPYGCTEQTLNRFIPAVIAQRMLKDMNLNLTEIRTKRANLNPQELGDAVERSGQWRQWQGNPVFDETKLKEMVASGVEKLASMRNGDGGWGWFSGHGEKSYPHTTAVVVHGLLTGKAAGASVNDGMLTGGIAWLSAYEDEQVQALNRFADREEKTKAGITVKPSEVQEKA
ncbi:MAG: alpha-2-macroglobulin, partial [Verrucomicrobiaceae bacterium]